MKPLLSAWWIFCGVLSAQTPVYKVVVTSRTTKAINYQHRSGSTKIDFSGIALVLVDSESRRTQVQTVASSVPNVQQVVNELQVKNQKASSSN